ncbi:prorelaxin H1 [Syngnathus typhle]
MFLRLALCGLVLALVACADSSVQAQSISKALFLPRDYGVKLCGREFIRAVIFTCGGSRWKRLDNAEDDSFQWRPHSDITNLLPKRTSSTFISLFNAASSTSDKDRSSIILEEPLKEGWPENSGRRRRHFSQGVAGVCCSEGCTKNDIGQLC